MNTIEKGFAVKVYTREGVPSFVGPDGDLGYKLPYAQMHETRDAAIVALKEFEASKHFKQGDEAIIFEIE